MSRQPTPPGRRRRPVRPRRTAGRACHGLDQRGGDDQRQVADRRDRLVVGRGVHHAPVARRRPRASAVDALDVGRARAPRPGRDPRPSANRSASPPRSRPVSRPAIGWPPTNRSRARRRARRAAAFVLATSVTTAPGDQRAGATARRGRRADEAVDAGAGEDDQVGASRASGRGRRRPGRARRPRARRAGPAAGRAPCRRASQPWRLGQAQTRGRSIRRSARSRGTRRGRGARPTGRPGQSTQPGSLPDSGPPVGPPPRRRRPRRSVDRRSASGSGGPGSSGGFCRRLVRRRSVSRRSSSRQAPQRGQRRSSANSDSSGGPV